MTGKIILSACIAACSLQAIQAQEITLRDIWLKGTYQSEYVYGLRSMNDGEHYTTFGYNKSQTYVLKHSYEDDSQVDTLLSSAWLPQPVLFEDYAFSNDEKQLLLKTEVENIYRHSTREYNYIYNLETKSLNQLDTESKQRYATFNPQGDKVAYVSGNNLFIRDIASGEVIQVTKDGRYNHIINGATDWVYEEEFTIAKGFFWSPTGRYIAFLHFDESAVPEFNMSVYYGQLYPQDYKFKYPKAGEVNSKVSIMVYDLEQNQVSDIIQTNKEIEYLPRIKWVSEHRVAYQALNRLQNHLEINIYDIKDGDYNKVYTEDSETYIEVIDGWELVGNKLFITSEQSGHNHIYSVDVKSGNTTAVTSGKFDVTDFYGTDGSKYVYFQSAEESPMKRSVYRIAFNGKDKTKLTSEEGWNNADFSTGMKYFINGYSSANDPGNYTLFNAEGKKIKTLRTNDKLREKLTKASLSEKTFMTIPTEQFDLNAWMIKPSDFDPNKQYPVLITIYGGPGSQEVVDNWDGANMMWHQLLADKGYIIVSVDNRGTGARGTAFKKMTYQNLGALELEDYMATAEYLGKQNYIDAKRIGIWGWSYGGYMSSLAATKGSSAFKAAIAVAPVTTWRFYDNIYTERYNGIPQDNAAGYDDNSPINFAQELNSNYLLIHGTADDNVHFQNAVEMVNALVKAGKQFDSFYYPDRNHGIYGGNTRHHIYQLMTDWLQENL